MTRSVSMTPRCLAAARLTAVPAHLVENPLSADSATAIRSTRELMLSRYRAQAMSPTVFPLEWPFAESAD
jgi:hypothetical protein